MNPEPDAVIFRKWKNGAGVIALFPFIKWNNSGLIASYEHIGQHGGASALLTQSHTVPAEEKDYAPLKAELEQRGYNLRVLKRMPSHREMNRK